MDELFTGKVPHSATAEQAVIGSILIDPRCVPEVMEKLKADDFYIEVNRDLFETVANMFAFGQTIDPVTVLDQMKVLGFKHDNAETYVMELMRMTPTAANVGEYAKIVRDKSLLRHLGDTADEIGKLVREEGGEADAILELSERKIYALRQGRNIAGLVPVSQVIQTVYDELADASAEGGKLPGLSTGLPDIDRTILGLNKGEFVLIAARPGMGKTSIALNMALNVAKRAGKAVAIFSLEMSKEQLVKRLLASEAMVPLQKLLTGDLQSEEWRRITAAAQTISKTEIRIDDNPVLTVADMNAACRRITNLGLIVIDYLQLMQSAGSSNSWSNESRTQAVSDISRMMKIMAKELNIPVLCLSQLSRANETRQEKRPMLSDLRESGAIEQDADVVIGLYMDSYYNKETENPALAEAIVLKNRKGRTGTINLTWLAEYTTFVSYEGNREDES